MIVGLSIDYLHLADHMIIETDHHHSPHPPLLSALTI